MRVIKALTLRFVAWATGSVCLKELFTRDRVAGRASQKWNLDFSLKVGQDLYRQNK